MPNLKGSESEQVDANIVVLPACARFVVFALDVVLELLIFWRTICPIRLAPERAFPVASLTKQVVPGDLAVVFASKLFPRNVRGNRVVHIGDEATIVSQADGCCKETLSDAKGHINAIRFTPLSNDYPCLMIKPVGSPRFSKGPSGSP